MIGYKIREQREKLGLTQEELGVKAGITKSPRQRIYGIENGDRNPSPTLLRDICEAMGTTPGELTGTIPEKVKKILNRGEIPYLETEHEFYYLAGVFVATLVSFYPASAKFKTEYFQPQNIYNGEKLKARIKKDLFTQPTSKAFKVESETRNKLIAAFFGWQSEVNSLDTFNKLNLMEQYSLGYFQTTTYPII